MGRDYKKNIDDINKALSKDECAGSSIFLYGSRALQMGKQSSDLDFILSTKKELRPERKKVIRQKLSKLRYNVLIFSEHALSSALPILFLDSTAIEGAARYGLRIRGSFELKSSMSDKSFAYCRLIQALAVLVEWDDWIISQKKTIFSDAQFITKEFCLISVLIWYFEKKITMTSLLSFSHFVQNNLEGMNLSTIDDELWIPIEKSGQFWLWVDESFAMPLNSAQLDRWAINIGKRLKVHISGLTHIEDLDFCREFMLAQKDDRIFKGLEWVVSRPDFYKVQGAAFGVLMRLALGLSRRGR